MFQDLEALRGLVEIFQKASEMPKCPDLLHGGRDAHDRDDGDEGDNEGD